jgi:hypothetical protein
MLLLELPMTLVSELRLSMELPNLAGCAFFGDVCLPKL